MQLADAQAAKLHKKLSHFQAMDVGVETEGGSVRGARNDLLARSRPNVQDVVTAPTAQTETAI